MNTKDILIYTDWYTEVIEDVSNPALKEVANIKAKVEVALTMKEWDEYMDLTWTQRELYIREKALSLIQK